MNTVKPAQSHLNSKFKQGNPSLDAARRRYLDNRRKLDVEILPTLKARLKPTTDHAKAYQFAASQDNLRIEWIEPLLRQAATYLDSFMSSEVLYRDLLNQQTNLSLDLAELVQLQEIHDAEVAAGVFQVPFWGAEATLLSDKAYQTAQTNFSSWVQSKATDQKKIAAMAAENSVRPFLNWDASKQADHTPKMAGGLTITQDDKTNVLGTDPGTSGYAIGSILAFRNCDYSFTYQQKQAEALMAPVAARLASVSNYASYLSLDAGFRERRRIVAHEKLTARLSEMNTANGPMNYSDRIGYISSVALSRLDQAVVRLTAVILGFKAIFNVDLPALPTVPSPGQVAPGLPTLIPSFSPSYLCEMMQWLQSTSQRLTNIVNRDQAVVHRLSVRGVLGGTTFADMNGRKKWVFEVRSDRFSNLKLVRMRGISAMVKLTFFERVEADIPPGLIVTPPKTATMLFGANSSVIRDQFSAPCWIGRPESWGKNGALDVVGTGAVFNCSPIGHWTIEIAPGQQGVELSDIVLDLYLSVQHDSAEA